MALIQHWALDDNAASTTVVATVGTNATLEGGDNTSVKSVAGPGGIITAGFDLNGTDDAIDISAAGVSFATSTAYSVSLWFFADTSATPFVGVAGANNPTIRQTTDTAIAAGTVDGTQAFTVDSIGTAAWHHLLVTRTAGNSIRVFVDTVESSSGALPRSGIFAPTKIGQRNALFCNGKLAYVKIFDSDESANVATLYAEGVSAGGVAIPIAMYHYLHHNH